MSENGRIIYAANPADCVCCDVGSQSVTPSGSASASASIPTVLTPCCDDPMPRCLNVHVSGCGTPTDAVLCWDDINQEWNQDYLGADLVVKWHVRCPIKDDFTFETGDSFDTINLSGTCSPVSLSGSGYDAVCGGIITVTVTG